MNFFIPRASSLRLPSSPRVYVSQPVNCPFRHNPPSVNPYSVSDFGWTRSCRRTERKVSNWKYNLSVRVELFSPPHKPTFCWVFAVFAILMLSNNAFLLLPNPPPPCSILSTAPIWSNRQISLIHRITIKNVSPFFFINSFFLLFLPIFIILKRASFFFYLHKCVCRSCLQIASSDGKLMVDRWVREEAKICFMRLNFQLDQPD